MPELNAIAGMIIKNLQGKYLSVKSLTFEQCLVRVDILIELDPSF